MTAVDFNRHLVGGGDCQDTLVKTADGWHIAERDVSRGNRLGTDRTEGHDRHLTRPA